MCRGGVGSGGLPGAKVPMLHLVSCAVQTERGHLPVPGSLDTGADSGTPWRVHLPGLGVSPFLATRGFSSCLEWPEAVTEHPLHLEDQTKGS